MPITRTSPLFPVAGAVPLSWLRQQQIMHLFNNLFAKRDINPGNTLIDANRRAWFTDGTRAFSTVDDLLHPEAIIWCERGEGAVIFDMMAGAPAPGFRADATEVEGHDARSS